MELISVIVPVYNVEKYLHKCLDSILAQTYKNLEIILVDDGSEDNSGKICDEYAKKDSRVVVIRKKNGGASSARNAAFEIARGDYIGFVDSDDYIDPKMFEILYDGAVKNGADISVCGYCRVYANGKTTPDAGEGYEQIFYGEDAVKRALLGKPYQGHLWTKLFKRSVINGVRNNEEVSLYEDMLFIYQLADNINKVYFTPETLYYYVMRGSSAIHSTTIDNCGRGRKTFEIMLDDAQKKHPSLLPYVKYVIMNINIFAVIWSVLGAANKDDFNWEGYKSCRRNFKKVFNWKSMSLIESRIKKIGFILFYINLRLFVAVFNSKFVKSRLSGALS